MFTQVAVLRGFEGGLLRIFSVTPYSPKLDEKAGKK